MHSRFVIVLLVGILVQGCTFNFPLFPIPGPMQETQISGTGDGKVLLIDLSGVISSQDKEGLIRQPNMLATFREELTKASKDEKIQALVVRINSPGGTVTASDILYHELREFKAKKKVPVIASMMDVATSGGYYLAMAADRIVVHPSTVTGSIGVIMLTVNARGLLEKVGVEANAITSGPRKDMGLPFRAMTAEERLAQACEARCHHEWGEVSKAGELAREAIGLLRERHYRPYKGHWANCLAHKSGR